MEQRFKASHRFARVAPRKARYVMDLIRHRPVEEALHILKFTNRRAATMIDKVVRSALANAGEAAVRAKRRIEAGNLVITEAVVEEGPTMHRWRPRSRGMANPIKKRNCHLVVALAPADAVAAEKAAKKKRKGVKAEEPEPAEAKAEDPEAAEDVAEATEAEAPDADDTADDTAEDTTEGDVDAAGDDANEEAADDEAGADDDADVEADDTAEHEDTDDEDKKD